MKGAITVKDRFDRIESFLIWLYGEQTEPLRSCLEWSEVYNLTRLSSIGRQVTSDLEIRLYPVKWCRAIENSIGCGMLIEDWDFWQSARLFYLEAGGEYKQEFAPPPRM